LEDFAMAHVWEIMPGQLQVPGHLFQADIFGAAEQPAGCVISCTVLSDALVIIPRPVHVLFPFADSDVLPDMDAAADIAALAIDFLHRGKDVVANCNEGCNRSGLMIGKILRMMGFTNVVEKIQAAHPEALYNKTFADYLRQDQKAQEP